MAAGQTSPGPDEHRSDVAMQRPSPQAQFPGSRSLAAHQPLPLRFLDASTTGARCCCTRDGPPRARCVPHGLWTPPALTSPLAVPPPPPAATNLLLLCPAAAPFACHRRQDLQDQVRAVPHRGAGRGPQAGPQPGRPVWPQDRPGGGLQVRRSRGLAPIPCCRCCWLNHWPAQRRSIHQLPRRQAAACSR